MKLNFNKQQCFAVPLKLYALINTELAKVEAAKTNVCALTFNFCDSNYSVNKGGYHPVELRLDKHNEQWEFVYITDFSYQGYPAELVKEIDVCFESNQVYSLYAGWLNQNGAKELIKIFITNFIEYHAMDAYTTKVDFSHE